MLVFPLPVSGSIDLKDREIYNSDSLIKNYYQKKPVRVRTRVDLVAYSN